MTMSRINLLETAQGKNKRGSSGPAMPSMEMGDMGSPKLKVLVVLVLVGLFNLAYWYRLDHQTKAIAVQMKVAEQKNRELADVKARYMERQVQANNYKRRVDVIDQMRSGKAGPVNLLAMLGEAVDNTQAGLPNKKGELGSSLKTQRTRPSA